MTRIHRIWGWALFCLLLSISPAMVYGQPFQCAAFSAVPPTVRAEGLAELMGDVILDCAGGTGASGSANFTIFLNTAVSSNILGGDTTEAILLIDEPSAGSQSLGVNAFQGIRLGSNAITWIGIPVVQPAAGNHRIFRFTNIRADATALSSGNPGIPATVQSLVSVAGSISIPISNPAQIVAFVQSGYSFSATPAYFKRWLHTA